MSIKDKVAIIGMGCTKFGENWDKSAEDMIIEAAYEAFEDAGIGPDAIDAAWVGTTTSGVAGSSLANPLKLRDIPITRVENFCATALDALRNAVYGVACGEFDIALVLGFEKLKDYGGRGLPLARLHPVITYGRTAPGMFSLPCARYFEKYGATKETLAKIAVKNHKNGALNPKAHFQREITIEQVMKAPIIAWPLGLLDCCPTTDGAAAAIITRKELAPKFNPDYALIKTIVLAVDSMYPALRPEHDFLHWPATQIACKKAFEQVGITNPRKQLSLAEVHDCFTITELLIYEDMGLCEKGQAKEMVDAGVFELNGELPVNPDGGLKSFGHPVGASGLRMIYEIYKQLQGKAGKRQIKNVELGIAHNLGGPPQVCGVAIIGR